MDRERRDDCSAWAGRNCSQAAEGAAGSAVIHRGVLPALLATFRPAVWPYATAALLLGGVGTTGRWLWRTDRIAHARDLRRRQDEGAKAGRRTVAEVDVMIGTEFEEPVASLCRRDGCTEVRRVGGSHDKGADVLGRHPDGRAMVIRASGTRRAAQSLGCHQATSW
jgi:restriction system protein